MKEIKTKGAVVRIHGKESDIQTATEKFMKEVMKCKKQKEKSETLS